MSHSRNLVMLSVVFVAACLTFISCNSRQPTAVRDVTGDYLFDERETGAVFLAHVYEDEGELYAMLDIADRPMGLELKDPEKVEYLMNSQGRGDFILGFSEYESGEFTRLRLMSDSQELDMTGERFREDITRLRGYHAQPTGSYSYRTPLQVEGGWEVSTLQEAGIDTSMLEEMMNAIHENYDYMHSILIVKGGKLVFEEYTNGWDPLRMHRLQSVSKSFTSTLVGIAIEEGLIGSINDQLYEYLPEYSSLFDESKKRIDIEHLLTMTAGFEWNELETYYENPKACDSHAAGASGDYIRYVLEKPLVNEPGTAWYYNSGFPNMLGHIIEEKSGMDLLEFSYQHLFEPLGIRRAYWQPITGEERPSCAGGLRLMSRDMARYGELYLRSGVWDGEQILPPEWIEESTRWRVDTGLDVGYGYFWKRYSNGGLDVFLASGTGGQYIVCVPAFDAVVVTTARYNTDKSDGVTGLLMKYIVPALATAS